jgi:hypothetical protein
VTTNIDALAIRRALGRSSWAAPQPFGPDGWQLRRHDGIAAVLVSCAEWEGAEWLHASIATKPSDHLPAYEDLVGLHEAVWRGSGYAYQVFAPSAEHVNIHPNALHLWGRLDGTNVLPDFGKLGTI